jgi:hypothetical protein
MRIRKLGREGMEKIQLAQYSFQWRNVVNTVMETGNFLIGQY